MNNLPPKNRAFFLADIITQSILIGFTLIALLGSINTGSALFIVLLMLIPIGIFQMLSAAIHLFNGKQIPKIRRLRNVHFWGGLMYLVMIFSWIGPFNWMNGSGVEMILGLIARALPLVFAVGYFLLTLWDYRTHTVRSV